MSFSPVQASLEGFRFIRDRPRPVTVWMGALLVLNLAAALFNLSPWRQRLDEFQKAHDIQWSWDLLRDMALQLLPAAAIALFLTFASLCIVAPSIFRVMLGKTRGPEFRIGVDEGRMFWLFLAMLLVITVLAIPSGIVLGLTLIVARPVAEAVGLSSFLSLAGPLVSFLLLSWIVIRLSLSAPIAIDQKRLDMLAAWKMTRGVFWRLFGGLVLALVWTLLVALGSVLTFSLIAVVTTFILGMPPGEITRFLFPTDQGLLNHFGVGPMLWRIFESALLAILFCVVCGAVVYAYRELSPHREEAVEDTDLLEHETAV
ncbi:MAG: hypothetical protein Q7T61_04345 [Caulobacter sp.]|nr:hypothetical protein [Caulobacter sp.]